MANLEAKKIQLQELREKALADAKEHNFADMTVEQKTAWEQQNEDMEKLASQIREEEKYNSQLDDINAEYKAGAEVQTVAIHDEPKTPAKTLGQKLMETEAFQKFLNNGAKNITSKVDYNPLMERKTLLTETGYPPSVIRDDLIVPTALRNPNTVIDLFDVINTDQYQYKYLEETTFTNNAAEASEGSAFGESALAFTERTENIRKFGVSIPVKVVSSKYLY